MTLRVEVHPADAWAGRVAATLAERIRARP
jgi:hypothetical protein